MIIKHKKNSFQEQFGAGLKLSLLYFWHGFLRLNRIKKKASVRTIWDEDSIYSMGKTLDGEDNRNQEDWRKIWGSKSGIDHKTNYEEIVAYRLFTPEYRGGLFCNKKGALAKVEVCKYTRYGDGKFHDLDKQEGYIYKDKSVTLSTEIELKHWIPVTAYAGGDEKPHTDFTFRCKIR